MRPLSKKRLTIWKISLEYHHIVGIRVNDRDNEVKMSVAERTMFLQRSLSRCISWTTTPGLHSDQNTQKLLLTLTSKSKPDKSILESFITIYFIRTRSGKIMRIPMVKSCTLLKKKIWDEGFQHDDSTF